MAVNRAERFLPACTGVMISIVLSIFNMFRDEKRDNPVGGVFPKYVRKKPKKMQSNL